MLRLPLRFGLRQRHVLVLPALLEVVPAMDRHLRLDALLAKQVADDALRVVDRLSAVGVGEEVRAVGADRDGSTESLLRVLDRVLAQAGQHVLGDAALEPRGQSPVFCHGESVPDSRLRLGDYAAPAAHVARRRVPRRPRASCSRRFSSVSTPFASNRSCAWPTATSRVDHARAGGREHLAQLGLRPDGAERARARADDGDRLVAQHVRRARPRDPVDRVLQLAGNRRVVLRRREEHRVGAGDGRAHPRDRRRRRLDVVVLVVRRNRLQPVPELELERQRCASSAVLCESRRRLPEMPRIFIVAYAFTRYSSAVSVTSFASAGLPFGSGRFQFRPKLGAVDRSSRA